MKQHVHQSFSGSVDPQWRIGIIASSFYKEEIDGLVEGAKEVFLEAGIPEAHISIIPAAGSFEIPLLGAALAHQGTVDALVGIGIIVEGETHHAALLAEQTAAGIMQVQITYRIPFAFEVLYVDSIQQARERTGSDQNKGKEAAYAVLHSLAALKTIRSGKRNSH